MGSDNSSAEAKAKGVRVRQREGEKSCEGGSEREKGREGRVVY